MIEILPTHELFKSINSTFSFNCKLYVDDSIDNISIVSNNQDKDFNNRNPTNINGITSNNQAVSDNHVITNAYVD